MPCDHVNCNTPYCPSCGSLLQHGSPQSLLAYLRKKQESQSSRASSIEKGLSNDVRPSYYTQGHADGSRRSAEKFKQWGDWVENAIKGDVQ